MRNDLAQALIDYGKHNPDVVVLDADASSSTMTALFAKAFPERFFNVGIAEAGMVDTAVGLALAGKLPFVSAFAAMLCNRALEQIRTCVSYSNVNVKLLAGFAGVSDYKDGATHHTVFDLAVMRAMPNMTVVVPADGVELKQLIPRIAEWTGPVYARISRAEVQGIPNPPDGPPVIGKGRVLAEGNDLTFAVCGILAGRTVQAREILAKKGVSAQIVEFHTVKPFDEELARRCAEQTGLVVTVEEHSMIGGLYGAMCESLSARTPTLVVPVALPDGYMCTGPDPDTLLDHCGFQPEKLASVAHDALLRKRKITA